MCIYELCDDCTSLFNKFMSCGCIKAHTVQPWNWAITILGSCCWKKCTLLLSCVLDPWWGAGSDADLLTWLTISKAADRSCRTMAPMWLLIKYAYCAVVYCRFLGMNEGGLYRGGNTGKLCWSVMGVCQDFFSSIVWMWDQRPDPGSDKRARF